jgi:hypothetical protein
MTPPALTLDFTLKARTIICLWLAAPVPAGPSGRLPALTVVYAFRARATVWLW